jgi:AmmeMemoRadiSam system protein B
LGEDSGNRGDHIRTFSDTTGYAYKEYQMDSVILRTNRLYGRERKNILFVQDMPSQKNWKLVICPHDDYHYAGEIYPFVLENLKTPLIIIFGVAHKAKDFGIEDQLVFDSFTHWEAPYGPIKVSELREAILAEIPQETYQISDSLQQIEHSVEALIPFIQFYQPSAQIISILVPYMNFHRMEQIAAPLAQALQKIMKAHQMIWGKDFSIAISNDCVHYGDESWGGKNYAPFGTDTAGYRAATNFDMNIISECLIDQVEPQRIRRFFEYTVDVDNYKKYAWTWCGRYSVPFGLLTGFYLQNILGNSPLEGHMLRYATSLRGKKIKVDDLGMGVNAPATMRHWVGYVAIGYREP